jgi:hypothetical protein
MTAELKVGRGEKVCNCGTWTFVAQHHLPTCPVWLPDAVASEKHTGFCQSLYEIGAACNCKAPQSSKDESLQRAVAASDWVSRYARHVDIQKEGTLAQESEMCRAFEAGAAWAVGQQIAGPEATLDDVMRIVAERAAAETPAPTSNQFCKERNTQVARLRDLAKRVYPDNLDLAALAWAIQHLEGLPEHWQAIDPSDETKEGMWEREYRIEHARVERLTGDLLEAQKRLRAAEKTSCCQPAMTEEPLGEWHDVSCRNALKTSENCEHGIPRRFCTALHDGEMYLAPHGIENRAPDVEAWCSDHGTKWDERCAHCAEARRLSSPRPVAPTYYESDNGLFCKHCEHAFETHMPISKRCPVSEEPAP